jgi:chromosome partitioning protein
MSKTPAICGIIGQKGGGGKTTIAVNIAVAAAQRNLSAVIIDLDQQTNAAKWHGRRKANNVAVVAASVARLQSTIEAAMSYGAEFIVIDSPGHNDNAATETVRASHIVLLPTEPQMFHFDTMPSMRNIVRLGGDKPIWIVVNKLHPRASAMADRLKKIIFQTYSIPVCPAHMSRYDIYATSADTGSTPLEKDPHSRAAEEIKQLYKFISSQLHKSRGSHVEETGKLTASA